ncbi:MAG: hypothetical protein KGJ80_06190 [Chloroflexota bacterium]|nr:hypothetical protein [Chloroflexota bacterium]
MGGTVWFRFGKHALNRADGFAVARNHLGALHDRNGPFGSMQPGFRDVADDDLREAFHFHMNDDLVDPPVFFWIRRAQVGTLIGAHLDPPLLE